MSARTEPCGEFAILTATLSLNYALVYYLCIGCYVCLRDWRLLGRSRFTSSLIVDAVTRFVDSLFSKPMQTSSS